MSKNHHVATTRQLSIPRLVCGAAVAALFITSTASSLEIELGSTSGEEVLRVGTNLAVSWDQAPQGAILGITLADETGTTIAHQLVAADEDGTVPPTRLWHRTGVVGCDGTVVADPLAYTFERFEEAEELLVHRTFTLEIAEEGDTIMLISLSFKKNDDPFLYFSDEQGCPRNCFGPEDDLYITGRDVPELDSPVRFFLTSAPAPGVGEEFEDVRIPYSEEPQELPPGNFTELAAFQESLARGVYSGLVRIDDPSKKLTRQPGDTPVKEARATKLVPDEDNPWGDADRGPCVCGN